jgi:hypothetical protein
VTSAPRAQDRPLAPDPSVPDQGLGGWRPHGPEALLPLVDRSCRLAGKMPSGREAPLPATTGMVLREMVNRTAYLARGESSVWWRRHPGRPVGN